MIIIHTRMVWSIATLISLAIGVMTFASPAYADCGSTGTPNEFVCDSDDADGIATGSNDDTVTVDSDVVTGRINTGAGNDTVTLNSDATVDGNVNTNDDDDAINTAEGSTITGQVLTGGGDDVVVNGGIIGDSNDGGSDGTIVAGDGNDTIQNDGIVDRNIRGEDGNDTIINNGSVGRNVQGDEGDDTIIINANSQVTGGEIQGNDGDDTVIIDANSQVNYPIVGGSEDETDTLIFRGTTPTQSEIDDLESLINDPNGPNSASASNTLYSVFLNGVEFKFRQFEELLSEVTLLVASTGAPVEVVVAVGNSESPSSQSSPTTERICENVKVFNTPDGFVQIYSGFEQGIRNGEGFLVAVFARSDAQVGDSFRLNDDATPNWSVIIAINSVVNVFNDNNEQVATCSF